MEVIASQKRTSTWDRRKAYSEKLRMRVGGGDDKKKSAWERRKEYSTNLRLSMGFSASSVTKRKPLSVKTPTKVEKIKPAAKAAPKPTAKLEKSKEVPKTNLREPVSRMPANFKGSNVTTQNIKAAVANKGKTGRKDAPKTQPKTRTVADKSQKLTEAALKRKLPLSNGNLPNKATVNVRNVVTQQTNVSKKIVENGKAAVDGSEVKKRPLNAQEDNLRNVSVPPVKRIRRGSFTISTGKENDTNRNNKPRPNVQRPVAVPKQLEMKKSRGVAAVNKDSLSVRDVLKVGNTKRGILGDAGKVSVPLKSKEKEVEKNMRPVTRQRKRAIGIAEKDQPASKNLRMATAKENAVKAQTTAKQDVTPLVRLPIRERLALWRERRETLEAEAAQRRKTLSALTDILNASRHERCFMTDSVYSCPYGTKKEPVDRTHIPKKRVDLSAGQETSLPEAENIAPEPAAEQPSCFDIEETLINLKAALTDGVPIEDVKRKLIEMKEQVPAVEKSAHYWEALAIVAEKNGNPNEVYQIYEDAATNEAEPVEVITEALQNFLDRLDGTTKATQKATASEKAKVAKSCERSRQKKRINRNNIFESTLIQYAIQNYSPFIYELGNALDLESPPEAEYIIPVRRSARLSKSARHVRTADKGIRKKGNFLFKANRGLDFDK